MTKHLINIKQNEEGLPKDISESTVIHLRLGDVVAGNTDHEKEKRPFDKSIIKNLLINDTNKKYIIGQNVDLSGLNLQTIDFQNNNTKWLKKISDSNLPSISRSRKRSLKASIQTLPSSHILMRNLWWILSGSCPICQKPR